MKCCSEKSVSTECSLCENVTVADGHSDQNDQMSKVPVPLDWLGVLVKPCAIMSWGGTLDLGVWEWWMINYKPWQMKMVWSLGRSRSELCNQTVKSIGTELYFLWYYGILLCAVHFWLNCCPQAPSEHRKLQILKLKYKQPCEIMEAVWILIFWSEYNPNWGLITSLNTLFFYRCLIRNQIEIKWSDAGVPFCSLQLLLCLHKLLFRLFNWGFTFSSAF